MPQGTLTKMTTQLQEPVQYTLKLGEDQVDMNALLGQPIRLHFTGAIYCKVCGEKTNKSFGEGFCFKHFRDHPSNSPCILKPELCEGHLGKGRDVTWEKEHHVQPHIVYLALTSGVKVGVTRATQVPTRWIDQGAWQAIRLAEVPYRQLAGEIEVALKEYFTDKTPWQRMLKGERADDVDLLEEKQHAEEYLPFSLRDYYSENDEVTEISYPVQAWPDKVKSLNLDKTPDIAGTLLGIRGQYLILDDNRVFNVRRHTSYFVELEA